MAKVLVVIAILAAIAAYAASPYWCAYQFRHAIVENNTEAMNQYVDYPRIRSNLKDSITKLMLADTAGKSSKDSGFFGAAFATVIVDKMIDSMITPEGLSTIIRLSKATHEAERSQQEGASRTPGTKGSSGEELALNYSSRYDFPDRFVITLNPSQSGDEDAQPLNLIMARQGLFKWRLVNIKSQNLGARLSASASPKENAPNSSSKIEQSAPAAAPSDMLKNLVKVKFLNKRFLAKTLQSQIEMSFRVTNETNKPLAGVKGIVHIKDLFGDSVADVSMKIEEDIPARGAGGWVAAIDYNQFIDWNVRLKNLEARQLKVTFDPQMVVFEDGSKLLPTDTVPGGILGAPVTYRMPDSARLKAIFRPSTIGEPIGALEELAGKPTSPLAQSRSIRTYVLDGCTFDVKVKDGKIFSLEAYLKPKCDFNLAAMVKGTSLDAAGELSFGALAKAIGRPGRFWTTCLFDCLGSLGGPVVYAGWQLGNKQNSLRVVASSHGGLSGTDQFRWKGALYRLKTHSQPPRAGASCIAGSVPATTIFGDVSISALAFSRPANSDVPVNGDNTVALMRFCN